MPFDAPLDSEGDYIVLEVAVMPLWAFRIMNSSSDNAVNSKWPSASKEMKQSKAKKKKRERERVKAKKNVLKRFLMDSVVFNKCLWTDVVTEYHRLFKDHKNLNIYKYVFVNIISLQ